MPFNSIPHFYTIKEPFFRWTVDSRDFFANRIDQALSNWYWY